MSEDTAEPDTARTPCWRGRGITFAPLETGDAELLQLWRSDPVAAHETGVWPGSLYELRERVERHLDDDERDDFLVLLPDGTPIGLIALHDQHLAEGVAEVSLMLDPEHRGKGHGSAALDALTDLAFGELPMQRVEALTHTDNTAALSTLAGAGFVREGVRRSSCMHRGRRYDNAVHSLLRPEWEALRRPRSWEL
ncbi:MULTISPECIES: GNAT family N-acetyltransferase [Streptomyces]|uniref:GNAT family protein n=2 Tax=Streptomyces TaxID=1883 RepID=A0ABU2RPS8_9ACTN|nr:MULTISPECIES: GNAT family protein [unclassified Streptomyces]MBK3594994.1 GNAT family N-acetyltransferase [Streptomyces sp. MBT51]MDT0430840.1 GNAT family protein [Streptomyces sp. DSM 41770]HBF81513.1 GNAT family N-acetyltransferase [Streptomyces sp.]